MNDAPLRFDAKPSGRIEVHLDHRLVGVVTPWAFGGRVKAHWVCALPAPGNPTFSVVPKPAVSIEKACNAVAFAVEQWFEGAGPDFSDLVRRLRAQRDAMALEVAP